MAEKQIEVLQNGAEVNTTKVGWCEDIKMVDGEPKHTLPGAHVLYPCWKAGASPHATPGHSFFLACKEVGIGYLGTYKGTIDGVDYSIPVMDGMGIIEEVFNFYITEKGLKVAKLRVAGNTAAETAELATLRELMKSNPAVLEALKETNPDMYAKYNQE